VALMCRVLGVSRAGFYAWERRAPCDRALEDAWLTEKIKQIHADSKGTYGARRVNAELRLGEGIRVGRKRVERLMRAAGIEGVHRPRRKGTPVRLKGVRVAPDLVERDFNPSEPDRSWAADITQFETGEGTLYVAHVQDLFSRRIVGWAMAGHVRSQLVLDALRLALERRRPNAGLVHHSDHGSQYTALVFSERCGEAGIEVSMGSVGDCFDNAVCESFHATLKKELVHRHRWQTRAEAKTAVFEYVEGWFNPHRRHSTLGYLSPADYERQHAARHPELVVQALAAAA
jgi:putative transposase